MRIIISPAKKMNRDTDTLAPMGIPEYLHRTSQLLRAMGELSFSEAKMLWKCSDKIAELNYDRIRDMDLEKELTPALLAYEGIQYQYMAPAVMEESQLDYLEEHLRILSGFYGILKPFDGVVPYRLEMQAKLKTEQAEDLYGFWGSSLYDSLEKETDCILNLASKEYSKCIEKYRKPEMRYVTVVFGELRDGKVVQKATMAKMARGEMVRYMARHQIEDVEEIRNFSGLSFGYAPEYSDDNKFVFVSQNGGQNKK